MSSNYYLHGVETLELRNSSGQSRNTAAAVLIIIEKRNLRKDGVCVSTRTRVNEGKPNDKA